jgi:hypothetical protein
MGSLRKADKFIRRDQSRRFALATADNHDLPVIGDAVQELSQILAGLGVSRLNGHGNPPYLYSNIVQLWRRMVKAIPGEVLLGVSVLFDGQALLLPGVQDAAQQGAVPRPGVVVARRKEGVRGT